MPSGWDLKSGILIQPGTRDVEEAYWALFNYEFSDRARKRNSYKNALIKAILDNLLNAEPKLDGTYYLDFNYIFAKFTENYWNLIVKYHLKQMRFDGRSEYSKVEQCFREAVKKEPYLEWIEFDSIEERTKQRLISYISAQCRRFVVGALYNDFNGCLYAFDLTANGYNGIYIAGNAYDFMLKHKMSIEKINYYSWAEFLERVNDESALTGLLKKLDMATPKRNNLSVFGEVLFREFEEETCFYCGKKITERTVDHFIPWDFVKEDRLWNMTNCCKSCNSRKNAQIPTKSYLARIRARNTLAAKSRDLFVKEQFSNYRFEMLENLWKYAQSAGYKQMK